MRRLKLSRDAGTFLTALQCQCRKQHQKIDENKNKAVCQKDDFANKHFIGKHEIMEVSMNTDDTEKEGMVCGGNISVMLERM